jgi:hypothetical protein
MNDIVQLRLLTLCICGLFFFSIPTYVDAQNQDCDVELLLPTGLEAQPGDSFCITIDVNNFEDVILALFVVNFNSTVLQLDSWDPTVSGLPGFTANSIQYRPQIDPDIIRVLWTDPNLAPNSIPDGDALLELCFTVIGTPGSEAQIFFNDTGLNAPSEFLTPAQDQADPPEVLTSCNPDPNSGRISIVPPPSTEPQIFSTGQCGTATGIDDGIVELKVFFGTPNYTIVSNVDNLVGTNDQDVFVFDNVPLGTHTFMAVDEVGLSSTEITVEITQDPAFTIDLTTLRMPSCPTSVDGRIEVVIDGGRPFGNGEYFFDWGSQQIGLGQNELRNLANGQYTLVVTDSLGCRQNETYELNREGIEVMPTNTVDALCSGISDGALSVVGAGGGPFSDGYNWNIELIEADGTRTPVGSPVQRSFTQDFTSLLPGMYEITATDSVDFLQMCATVTPFEVGVQREIGAEFQEVDPANNCGAGLSPAILDLNSTQMPIATPFNVQLIDSTGNTVFDDTTMDSSVDAGCLQPGTYTTLLQDANGCSNTLELVLGQGSTLDLTDSMAVNPTCFGAMDGFITVDIMTDSPPLLFVWSTGDMGADVDSIGGLASGPYTLTVSDQSGAVQMLEFLLVDPAALTVSLDEETAIECPGGTGSILAEVTGGDGNNTFLWLHDSLFTNNGLRTDLPAGDYSVEVTDLNGCFGAASFTLEDRIAPTANLSNIMAPSCPGDNSGTAVLNITPSPDFGGPFSFESSTGQRSTPNNFLGTNFPSGDDNFIIYSQGACVFDTVFVEIPEAIPFSIDRANTTMTEIACFGDDDFQTGATVNLAIDGPNTVAILWLDDGVTTSNSRVGLPAGVYPIELSIGTCVIIDSIVIEQPTQIEVAIDSTNSIFARCGGDSNTELVVEVTGGTPNYSIVWVDENNQPISTGFTASNLAAGSYVVQVTDANGCEFDLPVEVMEPDPVVATIDTVMEALCSSDQGFVTIGDVSGGVGGPYRFQINTAPAVSVMDTAFIIPGDITISVFDQNGCAYDTSILVLPPTQLSVSLGEDTEVELGQSTVIRANIDAESSIDSVRWIPAEIVECIDSLCSEVTISPVGPTTLFVEVTDINGCVATDEVDISVRRTSNIYIPNAFSPTATVPGNATFRVFGGSGVSSVDFIRIYDRYGNIVHAEEGSQPIALAGVGTWNGTFNNNPTQELESGVYVYVVQFSFIDGGEPELRRGNVTLIR